MQKRKVKRGREQNKNNLNKRRCERRRATKKGKKREKAVNREKEEIEKK